MTPEWTARIRQLARPMSPLPTGEQPRLAVLPAIRAVLFDVYGTLLISGSGELELVSSSDRGQVVAEALRALSIAPPVTVGQVQGWLYEEIVAQHGASRVRGIDRPEVDIRAIWSSVWGRWRAVEPALPASVDFEWLAVEFEMRVNPVWPMPHAADCLEDIQRRGLRWGVISNAQFFTPWTLATLLHPMFAQPAGVQELRYYSYQHGWAKPGKYLFQQAARQLLDAGIAAHEVLYVGNDMRNDIGPASQVGFRTALFAGDRRSLRWRHGEADVEHCWPDLVVVDVLDIVSCLPPQASQRT